MRVRSTVSVGWMEVGGARLGSSQWGGEQGRDSTSWENWWVRSDMWREDKEVRNMKRQTW